MKEKYLIGEFDYTEKELIEITYGTINTKGNIDFNLSKSMGL